MFSFLLSYQPFDSHHLVGGHKLLGVMKVTHMSPLTLCTNACIDLRTQQASKSRSLMHTLTQYVYCTYALVIYTYHCYVCDTLVWDLCILYAQHFVQ